MAALADLSDWMDEHSKPHVVWYVKRLAANDTLASGAHQAGPYIPKDFLFDVFPSLNKQEEKNPDKHFELRIDSHTDVREVRAVWYNNKFRGGTRNETRLTNFGGGNSPLLDPDSTGSLAVFAFHRASNGDASICHVWVCDHEVEADLVEERIGPVEPGKWRIWSIDESERGLFFAPPVRSSCWLEPHEIPPLWLTGFPSAAEIIRKTIELRSSHGKTPDVRLMQRRECEFEIFRSVERAIELPAIQNGFTTVDDFIARAQTILQRRKARSGRSLELHTREIFIEEQLREGEDFSHQPESESGKRPDFLFPSQTAYQDSAFPAKRLRMLAVKTTCKDRWRQILNEASRIERKHLLTLQEGVSEGQFREMSEAGVQLVVPAQLRNAYPGTVQQHLQTLESFIGDVRLLNIS
jgi:hypothetical protein